MSIDCYTDCANCGDEMDLVEYAVYCKECITSCKDEINELTERIASLERKLYEGLKEIEGYEGRSG
jgi:hypothetical protein